jgi:hypothetical protein
MTTARPQKITFGECAPRARSPDLLRGLYGCHSMLAAFVRLTRVVGYCQAALRSVLRLRSVS